MDNLNLSYDAAQDVCEVSGAGLHLETKADIDRFFDTIVSWWRKRFGGRRMYWILGYDGFSMNLRESDYYAQRTASEVRKCAITVVRFGGDPLRRSAVRTQHLKVHMPSNLYGTRDEALEVVARLRAGEATVGVGSASPQTS